MPERAIAKILRRKFRDALKKHPELFHQVPKKVWYTHWVVNIEPVGKGISALKYLAPYVFRVAISNKRILRFEDGKMTFTYKDAKGRWHTVTLEAENFIRRFLQHVLPKRFVKVRYYGFLSPRKRACFTRSKNYLLYLRLNPKDPVLFATSLPRCTSYSAQTVAPRWSSSSRSNPSSLP